MFERITEGIGKYEAQTHKDTLSLMSKEPDKEVALYYKKLKELGYNLDELQEFLDFKGDRALTLACAGGGKTTAIILKIILGFIDGSNYNVTVIDGEEVRTPKKIWVATFLKTGAVALEQEFKNWCNKLGVTIPIENIKFTTLHSEFLAVLNYILLSGGTGTKLEFITDKERVEIIQGQMKRFNIRSVLAKHLSKTVTAEEINKMSTIITKVKNCIGTTKYTHPLLAEFNMSPQDLKFFIGAYEEIKRLCKVTTGLLCDYDDINIHLYQLLHTEGVNTILKDFLRTRYDVIYIDEFQDTSQIQYAILKEYIEGTKDVIVVGDDDQTIYSWRASDINIITKVFIEDYKPKKLHLTTNYRCKSNILNFVKPSIEKNQNRHKKNLITAKEGGIVKELTTSINGFNNEITTTLKEGGTLGIIGRNNVDLIIPALLMEMQGLEYTVSSRLTLNQSAYKTALNYLTLFTTVNADESVKILVDIVPYSQYESRMLKSILVSNPNYTLFTLPLRDIQYSCKTLYPHIATMQEIYKQKGGATKEAVSTVYAYILKLYEQKKETAYTVRVKQFMRFFVQVLYSEYCSNLDVVTLDKMFRRALPAAIDSRSKQGGTGGIRLTTVHDAKGKEWDTVFVWNDVNGSFPANLDNITQEEFEEERRVHYIACTRAKNKLVVYTNPSNKSPFLKECDMSCIMAVKMPLGVVEKQGYVQNIQDRVKAYVETQIAESEKNISKGKEITNIQSLLRACTLCKEIWEIIDMIVYNIKKSKKTIDFAKDKFIEEEVYHLYNTIQKA